MVILVFEKVVPEKLRWLKNAILTDKGGLILSVCGGILLEIPNTLWMLDPYISFFSKLHEDAETTILMIISILFAVFIPIVAITYKYKTLRQAIFRTIVMICSMFVTLIVGGYFGIILRLYDILQITTSDPTDNAIGLMMALYFTLILLSSVAVVVINAVIRRLVNRLN